ncbi:hypothetical protein [Actinoplanes sp. OR16]|uniref:hypothetical protein n=1 Tax=Actinoplanes sp. OR16 TaxID=946334 RepID=UPI00135F1B54|nr:hypothetical protein [Actinoplanes sp. OR16]
MTESPADKETVLVDVSGIAIDDLIGNDEGPVLESLRRIAEEIDTDAVAGFAQGLN